MAAKKDAKGILSKPPAKKSEPERVSAGVYRVNGKLVKSATAPKAEKKPAAKPKAKPAPQAAPQPQGPPSYEGLNEIQAQGVNQQLEQGNQLGNVAGGLIDDISQNFSQPVDYSGAPQSPVGADFNRYRDEQIAQANQAFDSRMNPLFQQQSQDFEQQMANRGIPLGSALYNQEKSRLEQSQNDARQQGYYQGAQSAAQNAEQYFNIGTSARQNAITDIDRQRYGVLNDYNSLMAPGNALAQQNLAASQGFQGQGYGAQAASDLARQQFGYDKYLQSHQPRGGGGGGGAEAPLWVQRGYPTYQAMLDDAQKREQQQLQFQYQNNPQYQKSKGPSTGAAIGGGILGAIGQGIGGAIGKGIGGWF